MFNRNLVKVFNIVRLGCYIAGSLRVFIKELTTTRLYCAIASILKVVSLKNFNKSKTYLKLLELRIDTSVIPGCEDNRPWIVSSRFELVDYLRQLRDCA